MNALRQRTIDSWNWFPVSPRGILVIACLLATLRYVALPMRDRVLLATSVGGLVVVLLMMLMVLAVAIGMRLVALPVPDSIRASVGTQAATGLVLPMVGWIPCLTIRIRWVNLDGIAASLAAQRARAVGPADLSESVFPEQRGQRDVVLRQFEIGDVFGLCRVRFRRQFAQTVKIEPMPATSRAVMQVRRDRDGDDFADPNGKPLGDLIEMRHYRAGDPLKLVLWKHYARTGQVLVRQPENSLARTSQLVACFVAGPGDEATASVAAAIVSALVRRGDDVIFQADGADSPTKFDGLAVDQLIQSVDARSEGGRVLASLSTGLETQSAGHCLAFVPSQPGPWMETLLAARVSSRWDVDAIIGVDEVTATRARPRWSTWLFRQAGRKGTTLEQLNEVVDRLSAAGITTQVIDRRSGEGVSPAALAAITNRRVA